MPETDEKFIIKDQICSKCDKINCLAIIEEGQDLSERYKKLLLDAGYRCVKKGTAIICLHCRQKIQIE